MPILAVSVLLQLILIVHVIKTGRNTIWVFVLLFAPVVGGLAYLIVELLPEFMNSRASRSTGKNPTKSPITTMRLAQVNP